MSSSDSGLKMAGVAFAKLMPMTTNRIDAILFILVKLFSTFLFDIFLF
jgi:hypothetical protein